MKNPFNRNSDPLGVNSRIAAAEAASNNPTPAADTPAPTPVPANTASGVNPQAPQAAPQPVAQQPSSKQITLVTLTEYVDDKDTLSKDVKTVLHGEKAELKLVALVARIKDTLHMDLKAKEFKAEETDIVQMTRYAGQKDKLSDDCYKALSENTASPELQKLIGVLIAISADFRTQLKNVPALCGKDELVFMFYDKDKNTWYEREADRKAAGSKDTSGMEPVWLDKDGRFAGRASMEEVKTEIDRLKKELEAARPKGGQQS